MEDWRVIAVAGGEVLVTGTYTGESYRLSWAELSDGVPADCKGWEQSCSADDFRVFCELYNPALEGSPDVMIEKLRKATLSDESQQTTFDLTGSAADSERVLAIKSPLSDAGSINFVWRYECTAMDGPRFAKVFLRPLFFLTSALREQNRLLVKTVMKKNREIEEHRANGSVIKRAHLETKLFDEKAFYKDSLTTPDLRSSLSKPISRLLSDADTVQTLVRVTATSTEEPAIPVVVSPKKSSPIKVRASALQRGSVLDDAPASSQTGAAKEADGGSVDEKALELKRRAEIERLKKAATSKKRKTKSVF